MGRNKRLSDKNQIIDAAYHIMDTEGADALTMRRISAFLGVSAMTPYNYVRDTKDIRHEILVRSFNEIYIRLYEQMNSMISEGVDSLTAFALSYAYTMFDFACEHKGICTYLIGEGNVTFHKDAELQPFYDPFDLFMSELDHDEKDKETRYVFIAFESMVLSLIHEHTEGLRSFSKEEYREIIELFIKRMFIF